MFKHVSVLSTLIISLLLPFQSVSADQANNKLVNYDDIFNLEYAASPQVSPNGDYVIYERRSMDIMTDGSRVNLWQVNIDGTQHEPVFSGKASYHMPRFSPDGKRLAYLSSYKADNQLYILWIESGKTARVINL